MGKTEKKPAIRLAIYTEDWEERKASELFVSNADKGHPELPVLSATQDAGMIKRDDTGKSIFYDKANEIGYKRVLPGQFVIHLRSFQGGFAHSAIEGITSPAYTVFGFKEPEKHNDYFWKYIFSSKGFIKRLESVTYGIRDGRSISYEEFQTMSFKFPSKKEQSNICTFLIQLDNLITLQKNKCDKLKNIKKSCLEKMFPKKDSNIPEIRFKGFTEAWEKCRLGELGSVCMCKRIFKEQTAKTGEVPFFKIGTFGLEPDAYISRILFEEYKSKYPYPEKGDILISASGSIGRTVEYSGKDEYYQDSNIVWLKHNNQIINPFLKHLYSNIKWVGLEGSTIKRLYNETILKTEIMLPSVEEQYIISTYLNNLDNLITLHQLKLEKFKNLKQAFLEKMFV